MEKIRLTNVFALTYAIEMLTNPDNASFIEQQSPFTREEVITKLNSLRVTTEKRNNSNGSTERKPSKKDLEIQSRKAHVLELVQNASSPLTIADIMEMDKGTEFEWSSNQQVSGALRDWCKPDVNKIKRETINHKTCYSLVK